MIRLALLLCLLLQAAFLQAQRRGGGEAREGGQEKPELSIEVRMDREDFYERQPVPVVITLRSSTPDIAFADITEVPALKGGEFDTFQTISPAGNGYEETRDGKTWYCYPLNAYMVSLDSKGKYEYGGGEYRIGVSVPTVVRDPFWGAVRSRKVVEYTVPVGKKKFKVKSVPNVPSGIRYSGSVGQFEIETVVPPGDIILGEEATAYIILRGNGMIAERTLPEYQGAFKNGVTLKSVSESRDEGHDNRGGMLSEIRLECTFIPTDRDTAEIGEARFDFFNPETGKYETARSKPVKVKVKSSVSKKESMAV